MLQIFKDTHYRFMKLKILAFILSGIIIAAGIINITVKKGLNYGVDFAGGTLIQIQFKVPHSVSELRQALNKVGLGNSKIQAMGEGKREFLIRTMLPEEQSTEELEAHEIMGNKIVESLTTEEDRAALQKGLVDLNNIDEDGLSAIFEPAFSENAKNLAEKIVNFRDSAQLQGIIESFDQLSEDMVSPEVVSFLKEKTYLGSLAIKRRETVGPQVGHDLRNKAAQATIWALIGMLIYIGIRFKLAFGVSALITLVHDVLVTIGIFSFTNREINLPVIAAVMTLVGYSLNDTIVIFDRIRDNLKSLRKHELEDILDISLNQTLSRSIITSGTTFLTVIVLFLFGGKVINDFAFTFMIGIIIGSYSSIYQSCSLLYFWKKIFKPKKGLGK